MFPSWTYIPKILLTLALFKILKNVGWVSILWCLDFFFYRLNFIKIYVLLSLRESKEMITLHTYIYKFTLHKSLNDSSKLLDGSNCKEWLLHSWLGRSWKLFKVGGQSCLLKFTYPVRLLYHIWVFSCKIHEYQFLARSCPAAFLQPCQAPRLELLATARGTCGKWMSFGWTPALHRALGSLTPAKLHSNRQGDAETMSERKELFYYKSISCSPLAIPGVSCVRLPPDNKFVKNEADWVKCQVVKNGSSAVWRLSPSTGRMQLPG